MCTGKTDSDWCVRRYTVRLNVHHGLSPCSYRSIIIIIKDFERRTFYCDILHFILSYSWLHWFSDFLLIFFFFLIFFHFIAFDFIGFNLYYFVLCFVSGERPYKCTAQDCGRTFIQLSNLQQHMRTHCSLDKMDKELEKRYFCNSCGKGFKGQSSLITHQNKVKLIAKHYLQVIICHSFFHEWRSIQMKLELIMQQIIMCQIIMFRVHFVKPLFQATKKCHSILKKNMKIHLNLVWIIQFYFDNFLLF